MLEFFKLSSQSKDTIAALALHPNTIFTGMCLLGASGAIISVYTEMPLLTLALKKIGKAGVYLSKLKSTEWSFYSNRQLYKNLNRLLEAKDTDNELVFKELRSVLANLKIEQIKTFLPRDKNNLVDACIKNVEESISHLSTNELIHSILQITDQKRHFEEYKGNAKLEELKNEIIENIFDTAPTSVKNMDFSQIQACYKNAINVHLHPEKIKMLEDQVSVNDSIDLTVLTDLLNNLCFSRFGQNTNAQMNQVEIHHFLAGEERANLKTACQNYLDVLGKAEEQKSAIYEKASSFVDQWCHNIPSHMIEEGSSVNAHFKTKVLDFFVHNPEVIDLLANVQPS